MTLQDLRLKVREEFDRRDLKSNTRYRALDKVIAYIKEYHNGSLSVLQNNKQEFKSQYENYKSRIGQAFSSAESSAINEMYNQLSSNSVIQSKPIPASDNEEETTYVESGLDDLMNPQNFESVSNLNECLIPDSPGLYAIRIKDVSAIPSPFNDELKFSTL